jgi:hypothetical protein
MREKIKRAHHQFKEDPKLQEAASRIRPEWSLWGIGGVVLFFFLPELITAIWQEPLIHWTHQHAITEPLAPLRQLYSMLEEMFRDGVSWFNIGMGVLLLGWAAKVR